jgi:hypothetical protein
MQVMEAPVRVLRGLAAGAGKIIGVADRRKAKAAQAVVPETATSETVETAAPATATAEPATPEASGNVKLVAPETVEAAAPETVATAAAETAPAETEEPAVTKPEKAAAKKTTAKSKAATPETAMPETEAELPLANYDELTVSSLRARMTKLSPDQLTVLIAYEKAHQGRDEVVGMFERRIIRVNSGQTTSFQAVK